MKYRIGKPKDAGRIAEIQMKIKDVNSLGIFCKMRKGFLKQYYKILLEDPTTMFICAENENGNICGFCFNVLDAEKQNKNMSAHKIRLALSAIPSIVSKPGLLKELFNRYRSLNHNDDSYLHNEGAHGGYWGWDPDVQDSVSSFELHERALFMTKLLGVEVLHFEVDKENKRIYKFHKLNKANTEKEFRLPDGRNRVFMNYNLKNHKFKI